MAIIFNCPECGNKMQAPDSLAGQKARCSSCQAIVTVPEQALEAEEVPPPRPARSQTQATDFDFEEPAPPRGRRDDDYNFKREADEEPTEGRRRPCPMCGEMISAGAVKCRYCGEEFGTGPRGRMRSGERSYVSDEELTGGDIVLAILCAPIALILSLVWMTQGRIKGMRLYGLTNLIWMVIVFIFYFIVLLTFGLRGVR